MKICPAIPKILHFYKKNNADVHINADMRQNVVGGCAEMQLFTRVFHKTRQEAIVSNYCFIS